MNNVDKMIRNKKPARLLLLACCLIFAKNTAVAQLNTAKPWTYWWWMAGAVNEKDIRHSLQDFKRIGIGGVHIIPIYGVKGYEDQFKPFLGDKWMKALQYTLTEAKRLNIGVDVSAGSGWPFGGPNVSMANSAKRWVFKDGKFAAVSTLQKVKRAGPGGQGYVADPFSPQLIGEYLMRFDSAFAHKSLSLRSTYSDSYEVYGANWTDNFLNEFKSRRGYDLQAVASQFLDSTANPEGRLIRIDYQQTLAELLYDASNVWTNWSTKHHLKTRYQAHGSPGNILDLYGLATIPETEAFGSSKFPIPMLRVDQDYNPANFGRPNPLTMKFASSAAGLSGKELISSETATWLANHFHVSLSQVKPQVDELFTAGVNHVFFHGTTFSPQADPYPGWLFYASTNFGATSHFYNELPLLNKYITNCQEILQQSKPDNEILVYFPIQDIWADQPTAVNGLHPLDVHHSDSWFLGHPFGQICKQLLGDGFSFDYVSDSQLNALKVRKGKLQAGGAAYKLIIVPKCAYMPKSTLDRLMALGQQGATIVFDQALPQTMMGYAQSTDARAEFETVKGQMLAAPGHFPVATNLEAELIRLKISQETIAAQGLSFIRKKRLDKSVYFVTNLSNKFSNGWISLASGDAGHFSGYDPLTDQKFHFDTRTVPGKTQLYLSLLPGQSCFIIEEANSQGDWAPKVAAPYATYPVNANWQLKFNGGRPAYYHTFKLDSLQSWTGLSDTAAFFTGTGKYTATVTLTKEIASKEDLVIDMGNVNESAVVKINGKNIGTAWSIPFRLKIPSGVLVAGKNQLEIAVTNLSANYMRRYDREHPEWRKFYDANVVDITYQPFNASKWEIMPSGLSTNSVKILYR